MQKFKADLRTGVPRSEALFMQGEVFRGDQMPSVFGNCVRDCTDLGSRKPENRLRGKPIFSNDLNLILSVQSRSRKYFASRFPQISGVLRASCARMRGASRSSRTL